MARKTKLPVAVLERARAVAQAPVRKPEAPVATTRPRKNAAREKVIAALKKLHPMD